MDIHAPEGPVHTVKDFFTHISIVTVGILIALSLEGLREGVHNRHLVRETRENVRHEMGDALDHATQECSRVSAYSETLKGLSAAMPQLEEQHPDQVLAMLKSDGNPEYFLTATSFQVALSTGVLAHMETAEVSAYAYAAEGTRIYSGLQSQAIAAESHAKAYVQAHPHPSPEQLGVETEAIMLFANAERGIAYVCPQTREDIARALRAAQAR